MGAFEEFIEEELGYPAGTPEYEVELKLKEVCAQMSRRKHFLNLPKLMEDRRELRRLETKVLDAVNEVTNGVFDMTEVVGIRTAWNQLRWYMQGVSEEYADLPRKLYGPERVELLKKGGPTSLLSQLLTALWYLWSVRKGIHALDTLQGQVRLEEPDGNGVVPVKNTDVDAHGDRWGRIQVKGNSAFLPNLERYLVAPEGTEIFTVKLASDPVMLLVHFHEYLTAKNPTCTEEELEELFVRNWLPSTTLVSRKQAYKLVSHQIFILTQYYGGKQVPTRKPEPVPRIAREWTTHGEHLFTDLCEFMAGEYGKTARAYQQSRGFDFDPIAAYTLEMTRRAMKRRLVDVYAADAELLYGIYDSKLFILAENEGDALQRLSRVGGLPYNYAAYLNPLNTDVRLAEKYPDFENLEDLYEKRLSTYERQNGM